jgi:hypothetical protein
MVTAFLSMRSAAAIDEYSLYHRCYEVSESIHTVHTIDTMRCLNRLIQSIPSMRLGV